MPTSVVLSWLETRMEAERVLAEKALRSIQSPSGLSDGAAATTEGALAHA